MGITSSTKNQDTKNLVNSQVCDEELEEKMDDASTPVIPGQEKINEDKADENTAAVQQTQESIVNDCDNVYEQVEAPSVDNQKRKRNKKASILPEKTKRELFRSSEHTDDKVKKAAKKKAPEKNKTRQPVRKISQYSNRSPAEKLQNINLSKSTEKKIVKTKDDE